MVLSSPLVSLRFYPTFFANDCHELPHEAGQNLFQFLGRLRQNPYGPEFVQKQHGKFYAHEFYLGYVVYWSLRVEDEKLQRIDILKVVSVLNLALGKGVRG